MLWGAKTRPPLEQITSVGRLACFGFTITKKNRMLTILILLVYTSEITSHDLLANLGRQVGTSNFHIPLATLILSLNTRTLDSQIFSIQQRQKLSSTG
jgi:hypothetical protein